MNFKYIKEHLEIEEIVNLLYSLGATEFEDKGDYLLFPTVCHNLDESNAGFNLAYYKNTHLFYCFSECGEGFDIYGLIKRRFELEGKDETNIYDWGNYVLNFTKLNFEQYSQEKIEYNSAKRYRPKDIDIILPEYDKNIVNYFDEFYTPEWLTDGISRDTMKQYNIKYCPTRNSIIIPHYDFNERLVGLRERPLDEERAKYGKYRPINLEGVIYKHPTGLNLYGINNVQDNIKKTGLAIIAEGEKSSMQANTFLGKENNVVVAACGSNISRWQVLSLINKYKVKEIILAFDKEEDINNKYFNKLYNICSRYSNYTNMSFLYDNSGIMKLKDSPFDNGKEVFDDLIRKRIRVR